MRDAFFISGTINQSIKQSAGGHTVMTAIEYLIFKNEQRKEQRKKRHDNQLALLTSGLLLLVFLVNLTNLFLLFAVL